MPASVISIGLNGARRSFAPVPVVVLLLCTIRGPSMADGGAPAAGSSDRPVGSGTVTVAAAASLRDVLASLVSEYGKEHPGPRIVPVFGPSNQLSRQILEGAPVDLFISADAMSMDALEKEGRIEPGTRTDLVTNTLLLMASGKAATLIRTAGDLAGPAVTRIAVCNEAVPLGHYARAWLARHGILDRLADRTVQPADSRAALLMVDGGAVDAALVFATDARLAQSAKTVLVIPAGETPGIVYPAGLVARGPNPRGGLDFLSFLRGPAAARIFEAAGFKRAGAR
jgi:molybdate transport system substrate-binding protein